MNKRKFLILSSILCSLVTIVLVTTTLFGILKKNHTSNPSTTPTTDITVGDGDIVSGVKDLFLIVGDEYVDEFISSSNYTGSLLVAKNSNTFVAAQAGTESISIKNGTEVYSYNINVFEKGDGSDANPFNIVRPEDLLELTSLHQGEYKYYIQRCDLDLSGYASWAPIGKLTAPFIGSYDGNGKNIVNMNIEVTPENIDNYLDNAMTVGGSNGTMLTVGFFGFVGDVYAIETSEILGVNIVDARVNTSAIETQDVRPTLTITQSFVGVLAGYVAYTDVDGRNGKVSSTINSAIAADNINSVNQGITGFVGGAYFGNMAGYSVETKISSKNPGVMLQDGAKYVYYGANYAGLVGLNHNANMSNFVVELEVSVRNYENTIISGAIGYIKTNNSNPTAIEIKDIEVNNLVVELSRYSYVNDYANVIAGVINCNYNKLAKLSNVSVNNAIVNAIGSGQVSGIINTNYGEIAGVTVSGLFKGVVVSGVVYENYGKIELGTEDGLYVVDVTLRAQTKGAGVAINNYAVITGGDESKQSTVKASITWSPVVANFDTIKNDSMLAGLAIYSGGAGSTIEYINALVNIYDGINMAGAVGNLNGTLSNLVVNATIRTIAGEVGVAAYSGQTNLVGGIVALVEEDNGVDVKIADVVANITVNNTNKIDTSNKYGLSVFGAIVARAERNIEVKNSTATNIVEVTLYSNYCGNGTQKIGSLVGDGIGTVVEQGDYSQRVALCVIESAQGAEIK